MGGTYSGTLKSFCAIPPAMSKCVSYKIQVCNISTSNAYPKSLQFVEKKKKSSLTEAKRLKFWISDGFYGKASSRLFSEHNFLVCIFQNAGRIMGTLNTTEEVQMESLLFLSFSPTSHLKN